MTLESEVPEIRFGLLVSKDDAPETDPRQRVADHIERATAARDAGFDTIVVGHRYSYGPASADDRGSPLISSDSSRCWCWLTWPQSWATP